MAVKKRRGETEDAGCQSEAETQIVDEFARLNKMVEEGLALGLPCGMRVGAELGLISCEDDLGGPCVEEGADEVALVDLGGLVEHEELPVDALVMDVMVEVLGRADDQLGLVYYLC